MYIMSTPEHDANDIYHQVEQLQSTLRRLLWYAVPALFTMLTVGGVWVGTISTQQKQNTEMILDLSSSVDSLSNAVIPRSQLNDILRPIHLSQEQTAKDIAEIKELLRSL